MATKRITIEFRKGDSLKSLIEKLKPHALDAVIDYVENDHRDGGLEQGIFEIFIEESDDLREGETCYKSS